MKAFSILLITALFAFGCNSSPLAPEVETTTHETDHKNETVTPSKHPLALNNGEKWKADESTNNNVTALEKIVSDFRPTDQKTPEDYKVLHASLQGAIEKMVKECRMQGADHDALHLWLEPLMGMVKRLEGVTSAPAGTVLFEEIDGQIKLYRQFFA